MATGDARGGRRFVKLGCAVGAALSTMAGLFSEADGGRSAVCSLFERISVMSWHGTGSGFEAREMMTVVELRYVDLICRNYMGS